MARPSLYTPELITEIAERLGKGEPMAQICRDEGMPSYSSIWSWQQTMPPVAEAIARAREAGFDQIAQDALNISDDGSRDYVPNEGGVHVDHDHIQRSKLRVDTRLKLLAKWDPKRYGDKVQQEITGPNGSSLLAGLQVTFVRPDQG